MPVAVGPDPTTETLTRLPSRWLGPARVAWAVWAVASAAAFIGAQIALQTVPGIVAVSGERGTIVSIVYNNVVTVGYLLSALFIFWRRSGDWVALLVSATLVGFGTLVLTDTDFTLAQVSPVLHVALGVMDTIALASFVALLALFPDGRFYPRWTRGLLVVATVLILFGAYFIIDLSDLSRALQPFLMLTLGAMLLTGLLAQSMRYRRISTPTQRQQTKWVVAGMAGPLVTIIVWAFTILTPVFGPLPPAAEIFVNLLIVPFALALPFSFLVSTLRYRLWDIDYVISRSLVYAIVTLALGAVFLGGFFGLQTLLGAILGGEQAIVAAGISGAAIVGLFNPARRRTRAFVDRRLYGIQIDYATPARLRPDQLATSQRTAIGHFTGLEPVGSGGMAEVYRANHPTLNTTVAVKVLPAKLSGEGDYRVRFEREAQATARLKHTNVVQLHDFGVDDDGTSYMVMEYVSGIDLGDYLKQRGAMDFEEALPVLRGIASALDYAHGEGLVHRDVKPSNVLLDQSSAPPRAVLTDFGIARIVTANTKLTATGGILGTFDYIAPEQIQASADVDGRADVYSLGVVTYQMLTGELPFHHGNPGAILMAHMMQPPPDASKVNPGVPTGAGKAIIQAMAKSPADRFDTAGAFVEALA